MSKRWYVVHAYSGFEKSVQRALIDRVNRSGMQDSFGQTADVHSCSAGLDYPGVGPEHACWKDAGRVRYVSVTDAQALDSFILLARSEGIIPALESAHAVAEAVQRAARMRSDQHLVVNLSGRGDKDVEEASRLLGTASR